MSKYRRDTLRNRSALFDALKDLVSEGSDEITLSEVAKAAEVSQATAYRYFGSMESLLAEYRKDLIGQFADAVDNISATGVDQLRAVCDAWIDCVEKDGALLARTRSRRGYLDRLLSGSSEVTIQASVVTPALQAACRELNIAYPGPVAVLAWNQNYDPRDILDLEKNVAAIETLRHVLFENLLSMLRTWSAATSRPKPTD